MERFKIEHFERDRPGERFPSFTTLGPTEVLRIRKELAARLGLDQSVEPIALITALTDESLLVAASDAASEGFQLSTVVEQLDLKPKDNIYINWDRFLTIDAMKFKDFSKYFSEIWYPSADDIWVFDNTQAWILLIHHSGSIRIARFDQS